MLKVESPASATILKVNPPQFKRAKLFGQENDSDLFARLRKRDKTAFVDCINRHGSFVWNLAKAFSPTDEEAENATAEIFDEIWKYSTCERKFEMNELQTISYIARRYLFTHRSFVRK